MPHWLPILGLCTWRNGPQWCGLETLCWPQWLQCQWWRYLRPAGMWACNTSLGLQICVASMKCPQLLPVMQYHVTISFPTCVHKFLSGIKQKGQQECSTFSPWRRKREWNWWTFDQQVTERKRFQTRQENLVDKHMMHKRSKNDSG